MSRLYEVAKNVISANGMEETENILFGRDGMFSSGDPYFKSVISRFIKRKELIIRKEGSNLIFDLNNYNDIWNIIFLGEYIKENDTLYQEYDKFLKELNDMKDELNRIASKHDAATNTEEHLKIEEEKAAFKVQVNAKRELLRNYKEAIEIYSKIDWVKLENSNDEIEKLEAVNVLKQSINIIHKLRNAIQHGTADINNEMFINENGFSVKIPIEYVNGLTNGRIIAYEEDKILVEKTSTISSSILKELGYDVKKVESFFYNVEPCYLNYLLELLDYDYDKLYELNINIFNNEEGFRYLFEHGISLEDINSLNISVFKNPECAVDLYEKGVDISNLPSTVYDNYDGTKKLIKKEIDIKGLPSSVFKNIDTTLLFFDKGLNLMELPECAFYFPQATLLFNELNINMNDLCFEAFEYPKLTAKLLARGIKINELSQLPYIAYVKGEGTLFLQDNGIDITNIEFGAFEFPENVVLLKNKGFDIYRLKDTAFINVQDVIDMHDKKIDVYKLSYNAFYFAKEVIRLFELGIDIYNIPNKAFAHSKSTIELFENGIDIYNLPDIAFEYPDEVLKLRDAGIDIYSISKEAFYNSESALELFNQGINIYNLPFGAFEHPQEAIQLIKEGIDFCQIPYDSLLYADKIIDLKHKKINIYNLPKEALANSEKTIYLSDQGIDIYKLDSGFFYLPDLVSTLFNNGIDVNQFSYDVYLEKCGERGHYVDDDLVDRINYLLDLVDDDYERLKKLPKEFFECDSALVDEMYKNYNENLAKSIFGINNPKLIATLVYCDSVLKNYQKENADYDLIDETPLQIILSCVRDTMKYKNNITDVDMDDTTYLRQFTLDGTGTERTDESLKNNILDKMRNSICHFRFKPVKDEDGNIVEDKVYLYDKADRDQHNNFNIIMDINKLVELTHQIELNLETKDIGSRQHTR
ncbi:MAG: hypothetical protein IJL76_02490 [Bacilli bacterium]|nr:hypothetical protein [Bacilli bacterium]